MVARALADRLASLEVRADAAGHQSIIIVHPGDNVAALIAAAACAPGYGHLVLPADAESAEEWERQAVAYFERQLT